MKTTKNQNLQRLFSLLTTGLGVLLLLYMIIVEDEPGAVPLMMIAVGIVWFVINRSQRRIAAKR